MKKSSIRKENSLSEKGNRSIIHIIYQLPLSAKLGLGLILLALAVWANINFLRPSILDINQGRSGAFQGKQKPADQDQAVLINLPEFMFISSPPETGTEMDLSFKYKCEGNCNQLYLELIQLDDAPKLLFPVIHPALRDINWFHIEDDALVLYQREVKYQNFNEFFDNLPQEKILTSQTILDYFDLKLPNYELLPDIKTLDGADYILTTYHYQNRTDDSWYTFEQNVDTRFAKLNDEGQLVWLFHYYGDMDNPPQIWVKDLKGE